MIEGDLTGVCWGELSRCVVGGLADLFRKYNFLESNRFCFDTNTVGISFLDNASFTIDR